MLKPKPTATEETASDEELMRNIEDNKVNTIAFDKWGQYLGVGLGSQRFEIYVFESKTSLWKMVEFEEAQVMDIQFGEDAKFVTTVGKDRKCNTYQAKGFIDDNPAKRMKLAN